MSSLEILRTASKNQNIKGKGELHMKYLGRWLKRKFDELREAFGGKCIFCGGTEKLEFAHIKETGLHGWSRGKAIRYYDILYHKDSYRLMCKECHKKFDKGELKLVE
jgi:hypothetical protein